MDIREHPQIETVQRKGVWQMAKKQMGEGREREERAEDRGQRREERGQRVGVSRKNSE
jgi:hypothetical protein